MLPPLNIYRYREFLFGVESTPCGCKWDIWIGSLCWNNCRIFGHRKVGNNFLNHQHQFFRMLKIRRWLFKVRRGAFSFDLSSEIQAKKCYKVKWKLLSFWSGKGPLNVCSQTPHLMDSITLSPIGPFDSRDVGNPSSASEGSGVSFLE